MMKLLVSCALAAMMFTMAPQSLRASAPLCPLLNGTYHGTYLISGTGTIVGVTTLPVAAVGEVTFDGQGKSVATYTVSVNGSVFRGVTVTGTYTVNPDCTGTHEESDGSHYDFVVSPDGNTASWIRTDAGTVLSGTEVRLKPTETEDAARVGSKNGDAQQVRLGSAVATWRRARSWLG